MQVPETPKPSEEELQDRLKMFVRSRRGFAYGSKNTHPKNLRFLDDFGMCSPVYEFRPVKLGQKTKSGQGWTRPCFRPAAGCKDHILFAFLRTHRGEAISGAHYPFFACLEKNTHDLKHLHLHGNK